MKKARLISLLLALIMVLGIALPMASAETEQPSFGGNDRIYTIATAHLDTVWFWPLEDTITKWIPRTFNDNFALFEEFADYEFNFEGAYRYALMKEYYPEAYEQLKEYIAKGQWNVTGSGWENGDVNTPSAEALMRNFLYGNNFFDEEFGVRSEDIYLPDCFGFGYALPTIARHSNLMGFSTQKLRWGYYNPVTETLSDPPFDLGIWRGVDGSEIYAALDGMGYGDKFSGTEIRNQMSVNTKLTNNKANYGVNWTFRYHGDGDQGGGPGYNSVQAVDISRQQNGTLNGTTNSDVFFASPDRVYNDLDALSDVDKDKLPVHDDELVLLDHATGGYTSRTLSKRWNRQNEILADTTERAASAAMYLGVQDYPQDKLTESWLRVIAHQFHDDIPGTSLQEVYVRSWSEYAVSLNQFAQEYVSSVAGIARAMDTSVDEGVPVLVNNPIAMDRVNSVEATVTLPETAQAVVVYDADGNEVPSQFTKVDDTTFTVVFEASVPALGYATFNVQPSATESTVDSGLSITGDSTNGYVMENSRYIVTIDSRGDIAQVYDKEGGRNLLADPIRYGITDFEGSRNWASWELHYYQVLREPATYFGDESESVPVSMEIIEEGPARVSVQITRVAGERTVNIPKYQDDINRNDQNIDPDPNKQETIDTLDADASTLVSTVTLDASGQYVAVQNDLDWQSRASLLKTQFPLNVENDRATYDLGQGAIEREKSSTDKYEFTGQRWADITDKSGDYGVSVFSDSKYGWDFVNADGEDYRKPDNTYHGKGYYFYHWEEMPEGSVLRMTDVYTPYYSWGSHAQNYQDLGQNLFGFAIYGHEGGFANGTQYYADCFNQPMYAFQTEAHEGDLGAEWSFGEISTDQVQVKAIKKAEYSDEIIVRFSEGTGVPAEGVEFSMGDGIVSARELYASEEPMDGAPVPTIVDGKLVFDIEAYSPKTYALTLVKSGVEALDVEYTPLWTQYNIDVYSSNENPQDGGITVSGDAYPVELLPEDGKLVTGGVPFILGPTADGRNNATRPSDQTITLPEDTNRIYLLAAAAKTSDVPYTFQVGDEDVDLIIGSYNENYGAGDLPLLGIESYIKDQDIGFMATHVHTARGDKVAATAYMYQYAIDVPAGVRTIKLPANADIVIFGITAANDPAITVAASAIHDESDGEPQSNGGFNGESGFETGDPLPLESTTGNNTNTQDATMTVTDDAAYNGSQSIALEGVHPNGTNHAHVYFDLYKNTELVITPGSKLTYYFKPTNAASRNMAIDMNLSGSGDLRDRGVPTTETNMVTNEVRSANSAHPNNGHGWAGEWAYIEVSLDRFAGETINTIWFAYDRDGSGSQLCAYVDDLKIELPAMDLDEYIAMAEAIDPEDYTEESYGALARVLEKARSVNGNDRATTADKTDIAMQLYLAMGDLEPYSEPGSGESKDGYARIEAESADALIGSSITIDRNVSNASGNANIGGTLDGQYARYDNVEFDGFGADKVTMRYSVEDGRLGGDARIIIRTGSITGPIVGTVRGFQTTGTWNTFTTLEAELDVRLTGTQTLFLEFRNNSAYVCNLDWFEFTEADTLDFAALERLIEQAESIQRGDYIYYSLMQLDAAVEAAQKFLDDVESGAITATPEQLQAHMDEIEIALAELKLSEYNTDKLLELIAQADAIVDGDYTADSTAEVRQIAEEAKDFLNNPLYSGYGDLVLALETALENLVQIDVDLTDLDDLTEEAKTYNENDYEEDSYNALQEAIKEAEAVLEDDNALNSIVDEALEALADAIANLTAKTADKTDLEDLVARAEAIKEADYTTDTYAALTEALKAARPVLYNGDALQSQVDAAAALLREALDGLEAVDPVVNKTALQTLVEAAGELIEADYTPTSYQRLVAAIERAESVLEDDGATQTQVNAAATALDNAMKALVGTANKNELEALVAQAEALKEADYTTDTYAALTEALKAVRPVLYNGDALQSQVDAAATLLQEALDGLKKITPVDKTALQSLLADANEVNTANYTPASIQNLESAITRAEAVLDNASATESQVSTAISVLKDALDNLVDLANKTDLNALIAEAEAIKEADYTTDTYAVLAEALKAARPVLYDDDALQSQVDDATALLQEALDGLEAITPVDKSALQSLLADANEVNKRNYTPASIQNLESAITRAEAVLDNASATESQVSTAISVLRNALDNLVALADKSALEALIAEAEAIDLGQYTDETVKTLVDAMLEASAVMANDNAAQATVNTAVRNLQAAIGGLTEREPDLIVDAAGDPPTVTAFSPTGDEAATEGDIVITFERPMDVTFRGSIRLNGEAVEGDGQWSVGGTVFTVPYEGLANKTEYTAVIESFKDAAGNVMEKSASFSFTTVPAEDILHVQKAYIQGSDGRFNPDDELTRAQAAQLLLNLLDETPDVTPAAFSDVKASDWYYDAVSTLSGMGAIEGYEDGSFKPENSISRAEFTAMAARFYDIEEIEGESRFKDVKVGHWAEGFINAGVEEGFITGRSTYQFAPDDSISRAEAVTMLNRLTGRSTDENTIPDDVEGFPDVPKSHWAWASIIEAANDHTCLENEDGTLVWKE